MASSRRQHVNRLEGHGGLDEHREGRKAWSPGNGGPTSRLCGPAEWPVERRRQEKQIMTELRSVLNSMLRICGFLCRERYTNR